MPDSRVHATNNEAERRLRSYKLETLAGCNIQEFRKYRLSLSMHEHVCFDAAGRTSE